MGVVPGGLSGKEYICEAGDKGMSPGLGRFPGDGNSNARQYSGQRNLMDRGAWRAIVHGVAEESDLT